jgi:hypothetical protein
MAEQVAAMVDFYSDILGAYSYNRLAVVETPNKPGAEVLAGLIFIGPDVIGRFLEGNYEELAYMVATQWFGCGVYQVLRGPGSFLLGLSLPQHLRLMYTRHTGGEQAFQDSLQVLLEQYREVEGSFDEPALIDIDLPRSDIKSKVLVGKGPYVFDLLRRELGDDKYFALLKSVYGDFRGRLYDIRDWEKYLIKIDPDSSACENFDGMIRNTGMPE